MFISVNKLYFINTGFIISILLLRKKGVWPHCKGYSEDAKYKTSEEQNLKLQKMGAGDMAKESIRRENHPKKT